MPIETSKKNTLRRQFILLMFVVLLIISGMSAVFQFFYIGKQIDSNVKFEATKIAHSIEQGIKATEAASIAIERQLDLRLKIIAQRIDDRLVNKTVDEITNDELIKISNEFNIAGISIFARQNDDLVGVKSTSPSDIGFGFKGVLGANNPGFIALMNLIEGQEVHKQTESYVDDNTIILYATQSGSHIEPTFFKYAYYHGENKDYLINPFIEANEVYQFTQEVGPEKWIKNVLETNDYAKEIAVLDPRVYADPSLAEKIYPPLKKVIYGMYTLTDQKDENVLISLNEKPESVAYITEDSSTSIYKMFIPMENGQIIYVALDYSLIIGPLQNISKILLVTSFISLLAMFVLSTSFFSGIYKNIQAIIKQIKQLESGDFTAQSEVKRKGELADLSARTNHMSRTLNKVLKDTTKEAENVQNMSLALRAEANESVEKMYELSIDMTSNARDEAYEISDFLEMLEGMIHRFPDLVDREKILDRIAQVREISNNRSESTIEITITLSDLVKSLQAQSFELSEISSKLFENMYKFKLK